jgi:hypothetical protein
VTLDTGDISQLDGLTSSNCNVKVYPKQRFGNGVLGEVRFYAVPGTDSVTIYAHYAIGVYPITQSNVNDNILLTTTTLNIGSVNAETTKSVTFTLNDVVAGDINAIFITPANPTSSAGKLILSAYVSANNEVTVVAFNPSNSSVSVISQEYIVAAIRNSELLEDMGQVLTEVDLDIEVNTYIQDPDLILNNLVAKVNDHELLQRSLVAIKESNTRVRFEAYDAGATGNLLQCSILRGSYANDTGSQTIPNVTFVLQLRTPQPSNRSVGAKTTRLNFCGGVDLFVNAGEGYTSVNLTGLIERLPLGILLNDSDFLGENPLRDSSSALKTFPSGIFPIQTDIPLINGSEYSRFTGAPGDLIAMSDGAILNYSAYTSDNPSGTRKFRLYRGGGSVFVLQGQNPGGPVAWASGSLVSSLKPVLKGGLLVCKALLVRNYYEEAFSSNRTLSQGDEVQLIILTYGLLGSATLQDQGLNLQGILSPTGYGEGYAASDRYKIPGRPLMRTWTRYIPDPSEISLAPYPSTQR